MGKHKKKEIDDEEKDETSFFSPPKKKKKKKSKSRHESELPNAECDDGESQSGETQAKELNDEEKEETSFFSPRKKKKKNKSKYEGGDGESFETQTSDFSAAGASLKTKRCTVTLLVGLNNDTERYPLIFDTMEYQSYDVFDKKSENCLKSTAQQTFCCPTSRKKNAE